MNKLFSTLFAVVFATSMLAQSGLTCNDPIPVDENYVAVVDGPCELWYSAWTYDLPLTVHFVPDNEYSFWGPEVEVDFTCTPGVYADPKLDSLINLVDAYDVSFPIEFLCDYVVENGRVEWDLSVSKNYREQLAEFGVPYNVQAFIKVTYYESGRISLKPDTVFKNCMENSEYLHLGKTVNISENDAERVFVLPYVEWQEDSIQFVWTGEQPITVYAAVQDCNFEPSNSNPFVWTSFEVSADQPYKLYSEDMKKAIKENIGAGLFYAKAISSTSGQLTVEQIPMGEPEGGAVLMEYGKSFTIEANDTNALYCFPRTWGASLLAATTQFNYSVYMSNTADFTSISNVLGTYCADIEGDERIVYLSGKEIGNLISQAKDDYIYVRFHCASALTITPNAWAASSCAGATMRLYTNQAYNINVDPINDVYRLLYDDIKGYDLQIDWKGLGNLYPYISDTCSYRVNAFASELVLNPAPTVSANTVYTISAATIAEWAARVDADGFLYVRFGSTTAGEITFATDKPVVEDPILSPCVLGSTELELNSVVTLDLSSVHTIYRINYAEWQAAGATLAWEGTSPLHTFLASTCTFPVAPHNRYVLDYEAVLPAGEKVMAADWLARMAQYVDEDGYLYVRFLTEFEGTLRVK